MDGTLSLCELGPDPKYTSLVGHSEGVLDCDISESNELCVSCSLDGNLILWDLKTRTQLRCVKNAGAYLFFCKFLPR